MLPEFYASSNCYGKGLWGAIGLGVSSRKLRETGEKRPMFMNALINIADQKLLPVPGGVLVRDKNNQAIGSVGITGDLSDEDEHCAVTGIQAAGLIADTSKNSELTLAQLT